MGVEDTAEELKQRERYLIFKHEQKKAKRLLNPSSMRRKLRQNVDLTSDESEEEVEPIPLNSFKCYTP